MRRSNTKPGAVILDSGFLGLGAARSLARCGVDVCVFGPAACVARYSRAVRSFIRFPTGLQDEGLVDFLVEMADRPGVGGSVLLPTSDTQLRILSQWASLLSKSYVLTTPSWETVRFLYDKRLTYDLARGAEIATPRSYTPGSAERAAVLDLDLPAVIKPAIAPRYFPANKAHLAETRKELRSRFDEMARIVGPEEVIVQEFLPNPAINLFSYAGFFVEGEARAGLAVQRSRQVPSDFGLHSTYVEVVGISELEALASRLLRTIRYTGLAEVEFMWDPKQNLFKLLEVNARLWAWNSLATAAGQNLPYVAYAAALGHKLPLGTVRQGARWVALLPDIRNALGYKRRGKLSFRQYLASMRGLTAYAIWSLADPAPFVAGLVWALRHRLKDWGNR